MNPLEIAMQLERLIRPTVEALKIQDNTIEGLLRAQYQFTTTISSLELQVEKLQKENAELWDKLKWNKQ